VGEHDEATEAAPVQEELAAAREGAAGLDAGAAAPGLAVAGARVAARAGAGAGLPPGRGAGRAVAERLLALQRASGNATAKRMLARHDPVTSERVIPPPGAAADVAAWVIEREKAKPETDLVAVVDGGWVVVFSATAPPVPLHRFKLGEAPPLGVWTSHHYSSGAWPLEHRPTFGDWHPASLGGSADVSKLVHEVDELAFRELRKSVKDRLLIAVPGARPAPVVVVTPVDPDWGLRRVEALEAALRGEAAEAGPRPDRLVAWKRKDGKWFVNVWRKGDLRTLELESGEEPKKLLARVRDATARMEADADPQRSVRVRGTKAGPPELKRGLAPGEFTIPEGTPFDPANGLKANSPPFPARIVSHGPEGLAGNEDYEATVTGATVDFTMDLDYAAVTHGFWEEFGARWQVMAYRWELFDISKLRLEQIKGALGRPTSDIKADIAKLRERLRGDPTDQERDQAQAELDRLEQEVEQRGREADSGLRRQMARDVAATWEDTKADLSSVGSWVTGYVALVAVSDLVQLVGTPVRAFFKLAASPMSQESVGFNQPGVFLLRCFAQPVITPEDIKRIEAKGLKPIIRPPSVAYLPVRVTDINVRAQEANDAELTAIDELRKQLAAPPPPWTREEVQARIDEAEAALEDDTVGAINRAIGRAEGELERIRAWRAAEHQDTPLGERDTELRTWKAMLDIAQVSFADHEQRQRDDISRLKQVRERVQGWGLDGTSRVFRPRLTLVSEEDGRVHPIIGHLAHVTTKEGEPKRWRIVDNSHEETKDTYDGSGATHDAAINAALEAFAAGCNYGRGTIAVRLPVKQLEGYTGETIRVPGKLRAAPGFGSRFLQRLKDLATAAEVAALFVSGPVGIGIGVVGGLAGATVAVHSLVRRGQRGQSLLTFEAGMDVLSVVGAVAMMGGAAAQLKGIANLSKRAQWVAGGLHVFGTGMLRGQVVFIPTALYVQLEAIEQQEQAELKAAEAQGAVAHVDRAKYRARRLEALAHAVKSGAVTVRMLEMAANPEAGWNPLKGRGGAPATTVTDPEAPMRPMNALRHTLREIAGLLKKRGATHGERQKVIAALRTPHKSSRGALEGFLPKSVLAENRQALRKVRDALKASDPDVIVGMERGGAFLADALAHGDTTIAGKVRRMAVHKAEIPPGKEKAARKFDKGRQLAEFDALIPAGKPTKVAIVDYYMGGTTARELADILVKHYAGRPGYEQVTFEVHWIRETFGLPAGAAGTVVEPSGTPTAGKKGYGMYTQRQEPVSLVLGDDMTIVMTPGSEAPLHVFDDTGTITSTIRPRSGAQTTRDVLIDLLNRPEE
jgi:hypothetical protein